MRKTKFAINYLIFNMILIKNLTANIKFCRMPKIKSRILRYFWEIISFLYFIVVYLWILMNLKNKLFISMFIILVFNNKTMYILKS